MSLMHGFGISPAAASTPCLHCLASSADTVWCLQNKVLRGSKRHKNKPASHLAIDEASTHLLRPSTDSTATTCPDNTMRCVDMTRLLVISRVDAAVLHFRALMPELHILALPAFKTCLRRLVWECRIISAVLQWDGDQLVLLGTGVSPKIDCVANNDAPKGSATVTLPIEIPADWSGWTGSTSLNSKAFCITQRPLRHFAAIPAGMLHLVCSVL